MPWTPGGGGPTPRPLLGALYIKKLGIFFEIRTWLEKRLYKSGQNAEIAQEGAQFKSLFFQFEYGVHLHITACKSIAAITIICTTSIPEGNLNFCQQQVLVTHIWGNKGWYKI